MGRKGSRGGRLAALGMVVLAGALGAPAASGGQSTGDTPSQRRSAELLYHCDTESGQRDLRARVELSIPDAASGDRIGVTVRATLGEQVVAELVADGAAEVSGVVSATVLVREAGDEVDESVLLPDLAVPATPLPAEGSLTLTGSGRVRQLTTDGPGEYRVSADRFNLLLGWRPPASDPGDGSDGSEPDPGGTEPDPGGEEPGGGEEPTPDSGPAPTPDAGGGAAAAGRQQAPPARAFDCAPAPGQNTTITTLTVSGDGTTEPGTDAEEPEYHPDAPLDGGRVGTSAQAADIPEDCVDFAELNNAWCAYLGGYTNVDRMGAALRIDPGIVNLALPIIGPCNDGSEWFWFCQTARAELRHNGEKKLPPTRNSFHAFDFMPNEATVELTQIGDMEIEVRAQVVAPYDGSVIARATLSVRVYDVTVNGVALDVGENCRTQEPITVALTADYPGDYTPATGGFLDGYTDIPPFSGCGVDGDLDPLLTGLISGKDNYVKMTQGQICDIRTERYCPPVPPELQR
ncbi:DUF6801 domain-containing protein [Saccharomonospora cyanea]|uniref:DUF6801 domain-containing protein n=1 Tax=Saccharomonospora cyanea NA-134 TaxID=882082 RepID=H5XNH0_9PSEU|nr:DUF6801 domain-containing protein [Saccharomonospora cyanea]EHR59998.1 hypothetical protein SaccyDRAFT_1087 [Saccharomonospora cyanea NA-134]